jgi:hypothetical protein
VLVPARTTRLGWRSKLALAAASVALSLALAEIGARIVHRGAFPYLNIFTPDARYGVRLAPHASARVKSRLGRITEIRTNALGFRGPEWPEAAPGARERRVLIVGDSQMLGYGVDWPDATAPMLERLLGPGTRVLAAAVPSWGPFEYQQAIAELAPRYRPGDVIYVVNAANDWFETAPHVHRTTARDGWAAAVGGVGGAPPPAPSALRTLLLGRLHLVYAVRRLAAHVGDGEPPAEVAARRLVAALADRDRPAAAAGLRSPLGSAVAEAARTCGRLGCRLTVVVLPLDVQVDAAEWQKYRAQPEDVSPTLALTEDLVADARALGVAVVDVRPALAAAGPGAFLADDLHLAPRGHKVVAEAITDAIARAQ